MSRLNIQAMELATRRHLVKELKQIPGAYEGLMGLEPNQLERFALSVEFLRGHEISRGELYRALAALDRARVVRRSADVYDVQLLGEKITRTISRQWSTCACQFARQGRLCRHYYVALLKAALEE